MSGPKALLIATHLTQKTVEARQPPHPFFSEDNAVIDTGLTLFFQRPASFTGEDVVEFHCHGGVMVTNLLLEARLPAARVWQDRENSLSEPFSTTKWT